MKNQDRFKISIPTPCHEDWNKMTPNEKGSFCGKCCKTVVDFTDKSPEEIRSTLIAETGKKICGRFTPDQLDEKQKTVLNINIPFYLLPTNISYKTAFAIALFFAFGTSLFSCRTSEDHLVGDIAIVDTVKTEKMIANDTILKVENPVCEPVTGNIQLLRQGEVEFQPDSTSAVQPKHAGEEPKMGKVKIVQDRP